MGKKSVTKHGNNGKHILYSGLPGFACLIALFIRSPKNSSGKRNHKHLSNAPPSALEVLASVFIVERCKLSALIFP